VTLDEVVAAALTEDLGSAGDVTAQATVEPDATASAAIVAREPGVIAGLDAARAVFAAVDEDVAFTAAVADGDRVQAGAAIALVRGTTRSVLAAERTALNLLCHLSGVASATAAFAEAVAGTRCVIRDTRKTLPGLRALQKAAVTAGGGENHRMSLADGLLVKDNHVAAAGGVAEATRRALAFAETRGLPVQVEVDDLGQLEEALRAGARSVLLDNFALPDAEAAVIRCRAFGAPIFVEASGGVTLDTVAAVAATGVDAVAVGALTASARSLDVGLDFDPGSDMDRAG